MNCGAFRKWREDRDLNAGDLVPTPLQAAKIKDSAFNYMPITMGKGTNFVLILSYIFLLLTIILYMLTSSHMTLPNARSDWLFTLYGATPA